MKRGELVRHLQEHGCVLLREGAKHTVFISSQSHRVSTVPRHREINDYLVLKICRDLGVPDPWSGISCCTAGYNLAMEKFTVHSGIVVPLDRENVDTDSIIPKQFLKSIKRTGFGPHLFDAWRFFDIGEPGMDTRNRKPRPDFVLNQPIYKGASILLARKNFGCGSSREHAPWALQEYGFKAVIAPSFGDIFYNNSLKNGFLPIVLTELEVDRLFHEAAAHAPMKLTVDLPAQTVSAGGKSMHFEINPTSKANLVNGWDDIGLTLRHADDIRAYEEKRRKSEPWIFQ